MTGGGVVTLLCLCVGGVGGGGGSVGKEFRTIHLLSITGGKVVHVTAKGRNQVQLVQLLRCVRLIGPLCGVVFTANGKGNKQEMSQQSIRQMEKGAQRTHLHFNQSSIERFKDIGALTVVLVEGLREDANLRQLLNFILQQIVHAHRCQVEGLLQFALRHANLLLVQVIALRCLALLAVIVQTTAFQLFTVKLNTKTGERETKLMRKREPQGH